jgi:outer membrane protein assembly factor BamA
LVTFPAASYVTPLPDVMRLLASNPRLDMDPLPAVTVSGSVGSRGVSYHLRGKPLKVRKILIEGYGLLAGPLQATVRLPFGSGEVYSRGAVERSLQRLRESYASPGRIIEAFEDDDLIGSGEIDVKLQVLAYDSDRYIVNGKAALRATR